jgi:AraC-like DNA-binding protein
LRRDFSTERAARGAGYATKRAFFRAFHEATGTTPTQFRERERNVT